MSSTPTNLHEYSVTELSAALKRTVEDSYGYVRVRGELGRVSRPASGHVYLDLKDDKAVLNGVMWKGVAARLKLKPEQGLEVIVTGKLTTFAGQSRYQIVIDSMEPAGVGALMALLEDRKKKLSSEGLFDEAKKRPLPFLPETIGVVTSPSGAVIRDILHRLRDRFPRHVLIWPTLVQGDGAAAKIAEAIAGFNALPEGGPVPRPDVLIVARGGGSIEDLWAFNEEVVVRAAAASAIPLISAVGHETDTTLIDYASDRRAPTPTAAAEMAVPVRTELQAQLLSLSQRLVSAQGRLFETRRAALVSASRGLGRPEDALAAPTQRLDGAAVRFLAAGRARVNAAARGLSAVAGRLSPAALRFGLANRREGLASFAARLENAGVRRTEADAARLDAAGKLLKSLSHESVLARGFALVRGESGLITRAASAAAGQSASILFADGEKQVVFEEGAAAKSKAASKPKLPPKGQGSLF